MFPKNKNKSAFVSSHISRMILLTMALIQFNMIDVRAEPMSFFQDQSVSMDFQLKTVKSKQRRRRRLTSPSTAQNVCTHLPAFDSDSAKVTQCQDSSLTSRTACESYQYCTWNNGVTLLMPPGETSGYKCDYGLGKSYTPTTGEDGLDSTSLTFPSFCSTYCQGNPDGMACAGFEMKLWDGLYRCRAVTSDYFDNCITINQFKIDTKYEYSSYSQSYLYYQTPATNMGRCTHLDTQNGNYANINVCKNIMSQVECDLNSLCIYTGCEDTTGWTNGASEACSDYSSQYCTGTTYKNTKFHMGGAQYLFPERNCCECGKGNYDSTFSQSPSSSNNVCTHLSTQNGVSQIVSYCSSLTGYAACSIIDYQNICEYKATQLPLTIILPAGTNKHECTHKSTSNTVYSEFTACAGYATEAQCKADTNCYYLFYQDPLTQPPSNNVCTHKSDHNQDEAIVNACEAYLGRTTCVGDTNCLFLFYQAPLTTPDSKNVCTHKVSSQLVYDDVTACSGYGSDKVACELNGKCNFLFYQEPLTGVAAYNTCTHNEDYNTDETQVTSCSGYTKAQCQGFTSECSYQTYSVPLSGTAHYNLCTHLEAFSTNEAIITTCQGHLTQTSCDDDINCLWGFYQLPLSLPTSMNMCTHLETYNYLNKQIVQDCEASNKEQCDIDSNCQYLFWQEPLDSNQQQSQNKCTHHQINNADQQKVNKCSNLDKASCDADEDCQFIFWQVPLTNSTAQQLNVCTHLENNNYDEITVANCSSHSDRITCESNSDCTFIHWRLPLSLNTSKNNCTHTLNSSADGAQVDKCQSFKTKAECETDSLCIFLYWEEPKTDQGCSHNEKWNSNHTVVESCKLHFQNAECNNDPKCVFYGDQCKDAFQPKYQDVFQYYSKYKQTKTLRNIENDLFEMFENLDKTNCQIKSCELQNPECTGDYVGKNLFISEDTQILQAKQNVESGYDESVCIKCTSNEQHQYSQKVKVIQGEIPNVKPRLKDEKLLYLVPLGLVKIIRLPGVTRDIKHDGSFEEITIEHLSSGNDIITIIPSLDLFESAFILRVKALDEILIGRTKKIKFNLRSSNGQISDKYSVEINFIKNAASSLVFSVIEEQEDTIYQRFVKFTSQHARTQEEIDKFWQENSPIIANITDIDNFGKVTVKFDSKVQIYDMKNINISSIELNIITREYDQNISRLQFNFTCIEFIPTQVQFQLKFENPSQVSYGDIDHLELKVLHPHVFKNFQRNKRELQGNFLFIPRNYTTHYKLPQQMELNFGHKFQAAVENVEKVVRTFSVVSIIVNFSLGMSLYFLWGLINALQMIIYNPLATIRFPLNVMMLYGILLPISSLDIISPEISTDVVFTMSPEETPYSDILDNMGYDSHNFIYNVGSMFYFVCLLFTIVIFIVSSYLIKQLIRRCKGNLDGEQRSSLRRIKRLVRNWIPQKRHSYYCILMFNSLFLVFFEGYIEILLSCFLNNKSGVKITKSDKFSFFISYFFGSICLIIIPVSLLFMLSRNPETLDSKEAYKKYGSLYDGLNTKSRWCLLYNVLFIVRRLALLLIMFNKRLQDTNSLQILYLVYINFLIMMYVHIVNPFDTRRKNIIEKVNEACVFLSVEMMMFFTDMLQPLQQFQAGYIAVAIICLNVCYNMSMILSVLKRNVSMVIKKYYIRIKHSLCPDDPLIPSLDLENLESPNKGPMKAPRGQSRKTGKQEEIKMLENQVKKLECRSLPSSYCEASHQLGILYSMQIELINTRKQLPSNQVLNKLNEVSYFDFCIIKLFWHKNFSRKEILIKHLNLRLMTIAQELIKDRNQFMMKNQPVANDYTKEQMVNIFKIGHE